MRFFSCNEHSGAQKRSNTLDVKLAVIRAAEANNNYSKSRTFGIPRPTIIKILKEKEKILQAIEAGAKAKRARRKMALQLQVTSFLPIQEHPVRSRQHQHQCSQPMAARSVAHYIGLPEIVGTQEPSGSGGMESTEEESDEEPAM